MCIKFIKVGLKLSQKEIFSNVNIVFNKGFNLIYGKSGSGKTSLLKLINMLYLPTHGQIFYGKYNIAQKSPITWRSMCILTKQTTLPSKDSVMNYLLLPFSFKIHKNKIIDNKLMFELIDMFGLNKDIVNKPVFKLSGGEIQRITIIRTILLKPKIFLFDEPTNMLDRVSEEAVLAYIKKLSKEHICIVSSHSQETLGWCDTSIKIENRRISYD